jgi:hypothetical protein
MENIILKNMKIKTIMENMSNTLEEMKNYVNEIIEEQLEKAVLAYLKERGFCQNQISLQEEHQKNPSVIKMDPEVTKLIPPSSLLRNINAPGDKSIEVEHAHNMSANEGHIVQCKIAKDILRRRMLEEEDEDGEKENEPCACNQLKEDQQVEDHLFQ